ncbi:unnamed protein product [Rangifer tarandus platyrhynchus]|uniref:Uncharacterized protein n=2 Tax=Rangifer tarandus platyrhynchus TaxID=3082113 RepID=A0AC59YCI7_RANTA|nr:unnamed protein product [Rangifer tarandus platyrhynchus]
MPASLHCWSPALSPGFFWPKPHRQPVIKAPPGSTRVGLTPASAAWDSVLLPDPTCVPTFQNVSQGSPPLYPIFGSPLLLDFVQTHIEFVSVSKSFRLSVCIPTIR